MKKIIVLLMFIAFSTSVVTGQDSDVIKRLNTKFSRIFRADTRLTE